VPADKYTEKSLMLFDEKNKARDAAIQVIESK